ncbi:MAG: murein biosynthesis integral membrane protein MurJ [Chromatiales bacterium]|jgi:putative peptidoglycan lipid II flippase|nr:murein biosynthesis integral membrane protein MurJ [Chromatiales bacterium]
MSGLLRSTALVSAMTFVSRILGLLRDMVVARAFGAGVGADAFFVAFRIPNLLRRLFAEGAFSQAFVPVLSEYKTKRSHEEVQDLLDHTSGALGGVLFLVTAIGILAAPLLVWIFAPGFADKPDKFALTAQMLQLTFPYILFISLTALAGGVLNSYGRFAVPAFTPVLLNLCMIGAAVWLAPHMEQPVVALAWGVLIAGMAQLAFQLPFLWRLRLLPRPRWRRGHEGVRKIIGLMLPGIFGSSVAQINLLIDTLIASFLVTGSVSWLYYSDRLVEFPLGVFGVALATVILPRLSQQHAATDTAEHSRTLDWALRMTVLVGSPATVALVILAGPMLVTLFQYGEFSAFDVEMSTLSLMAYALGLLGFILVKVLAAAFFSRQDARTPVRIAVIAMGANLVLNGIFVVPMVMFDIPGPHAGLVLATALAAFINAGLLLRALRRTGDFHASAGWMGFVLRVVIANIAMGVVLFFLVGDIEVWQAHAWPARARDLMVCVCAGVGTYFAVAWLAGLRWHHFAAPGARGAR